MGSPKVTVLTPTYNRPAYLADAIHSVVAQDMADWEMLVINDGGCDVRGVVEAAGDERVRYVHRAENRGKAACLNLGLARARGDYIAYLDDDDMWYPNHLSTLARALDERPEIGVAYSDLYKVLVLAGRDGRRYPLEKRVDVCRDFNRMFMFHFNHTLHVSLMHRRELACRIGGYDEAVRVMIDWNLTRKLAFVTDFHHVQAVTGEYSVPIKDSDRISDVQREKTWRYFQNLRRVRADMPPEPWPYVRRVTVVFPVERWDDATFDTVRYLTDHLDYPCRIVLVDHGAEAGSGERAPDDFVRFQSMKNMSLVRVSRRATLHEAYRAGADSAGADFYYLPSPHVCTQKKLRLIEALSYVEETGCEGVRWPADGSEGRPFDVFLTDRAYRGAAPPEGGDWPGVQTLPADWMPEALRTDYLLQFARQCEQEGDYGTALALVRQAATLAGTTGRPYLAQHVVRLAFGLGDYAQAEQFCRELIAAGYGADNWVMLGAMCHADGRHEEAAHAYARGLEMIGLSEQDVMGNDFPLSAPMDFDAFRAQVGLGECLIELGRHDDAARALRMAARLNARSPRPYLGFARLFLRTGQPEQAEQAVNLAAERDPRGVLPRVHAARAQVFERLGRAEPAYREWLRALELAPGEPAYLDGAVRVGRSVAAPEELAELYRTFLGYKPGHLPALVGLGEVLLELGDRSEAARLAEQAALLAPEDQGARRLSARAQAQLTPSPAAPAPGARAGRHG